MSRSKSLILCVHAHQPVGNFGWVFDEAYRRCYFEFFEMLERHPRVKLSCHFSGSLLDWFERERPEFIRMLRKMAERNQIEIMGGAYYEPIYGLIPKKDLTGQLAMMRERVRALFGVTPEGAWLAERVWDPDVARPIRRAGYGYTVLDDFHLMKAGKTQPVTGYYRTGDSGEPLDIFASLQALRYAVPFRRPEETLRFLQSAKRTGPEDAFVFADDCEKFGLWPGTHELVYKKKWLERFFTMLEHDRNITTYTFSEFRRLFKAKAAVEVPHASYSEMMQWSGGNFYNFLQKYPESRYATARMLNVSERLSAQSSTNGTGAKVAEATKALYRAQCNCSYWHGVFGGLYLHHLRSAVYENLIEAERILRELEPAGPEFKVRGLESGDHVSLSQAKLRSFFNPAYGGALEECDYLPKRANLMCNLQRRREVYHEAVFAPAGAGAVSEAVMIYKMLGTKLSGLEKELRYDANRRLSFMDHFFKEEAGFNEFHDASSRECGDFIGAEYRWRIDGGRLRMERQGKLELDGKKHALSLHKTVTPDGGDAFSVAYELVNDSQALLTFALAVECNFSIGDEQLRRGHEKTRTREWAFNDSWHGVRVTLSSDEEWELVASPVETVSESESGLEKTYQGLSVLAQKRFALKPGERGHFTLRTSVREAGDH